MALMLTATWIIPCSAGNEDGLTARFIMGEALRRHELFPHVFEEQTLILIDRAGRRDIREVRRFSSRAMDGSVRFLMTFENPPEIRGVAVLAVEDARGERSARLYLPAYGKRLLTLHGEGGDFLGTDFSIADLIPERLSEHRYERREDQKIGDVYCFVVDAFPVASETEEGPGLGFRRHTIRKDIFFIIRTDYYDRRHRLIKTLSRHDLKRLGKEMWRPNMILMKNRRHLHQTLIKIHRRIFSQAYVPAEIFTSAWLLNNRHLTWPDRRLFRQTAGLGEDSSGSGTAQEHPDAEPVPAPDASAGEMEP